jgi:hypothetical protein
MSSLKIKRAVRNIKTGHMSVMELAVNTIQAIEEGKAVSGLVET